MKLIINISDESYDKALNGIINCKECFDAIVYGTPIPDNATNGEIMQMMFPNGVTAKFATFMRFVVGEDEYINCAYDWWNSPYQKRGCFRPTADNSGTFCI